MKIGTRIYYIGKLPVQSRNGVITDKLFGTYVLRMNNGAEITVPFKSVICNCGEEACIENIVKKRAKLSRAV